MDRGESRERLANGLATLPTERVSQQLADDLGSREILLLRKDLDILIELLGKIDLRTNHMAVVYHTEYMEASDNNGAPLKTGPALTRRGIHPWDARGRSYLLVASFMR